MSPETTIATPRMILRSLRPDDWEVTHGIFSDPEAMRFIPGGAFDDPERCRRWVAKVRENEERDGYGFWAMELTETGEVVGQCGLVKVAGKGPEIEVAYHLLRAHWGRGYATEAARSSVEHGLGKLGLEKIIGLTFPEHRVSQRVLEKAGLTFVREAEWYGMAMREYQITA